MLGKISESLKVIGRPMTSFSLSGEDDGEGSSNSPSKRTRLAESEEATSEGLGEGEGHSFGVDEEDETSGIDGSAVSSTSEEEGSLVVKLTLPYLLDCLVCHDPLKDSVFQCEDGHVACFTCVGMFDNICPFCTPPVGYIRGQIIERILQSAKLGCPNVDRGCKRLFRYHKMHSHKQYCCFSPRICPFHNCSFDGSSEQLSGHFSEMHQLNLELFTFGISQAMEPPLSSKIYILREQDSGALFILRNEVQTLGHVMKIEYLAPPTGRQYSYEIVAKANGRVALLNWSVIHPTRI